MIQTIFLRRNTLSALMLITLVFCSAETVVAQGQASGTNNSAKPLPSNVQPVTRPMYVQGAVVVLLMGAAVYAVCRSSRRV